MTTIDPGYIFRHVVCQLLLVVAYYCVLRLSTARYEKFNLKCEYEACILYAPVLLMVFIFAVIWTAIVMAIDGLSSPYITLHLCLLFFLANTLVQDSRRTDERRVVRSVLYMEERYGVERDRLCKMLEAAKLMEFPIKKFHQDMKLGLNGEGVKIESELRTGIDAYMTEWYEMMEAYLKTVSLMEEYTKSPLHWLSNGKLQ